MTPHITHLFSLLLAKGDAKRLSEAVARAEPQMRQAGETDLWLFWKGHSLLIEGDVDQAKSYVERIKDPARAHALDRLVHRATAARSKDASIEIRFLENRFRETKSEADLLELCEAYYHSSNWVGVSQYGKVLVEKIGTIAVLKMCASAAYYAENLELCLELLQGRENLFPDGRLSLDLRKLRLECWRRRGLLHQAIAEAEVLARETDDTEDILTLISVRLEGADPKGAAVEARELLKRPGIAPEHHLRIARVLQVEDEAVAAAHLEKALSAGGVKTPQFIADAVDLVFRLNMEDKFGDLHSAFFRSAAEGGPIQAVGPEKLVEIFRARAETQREIDRVYRQGGMPFHYAISVFGGSIAHAVDRLFNPPLSVNGWPPGPPLFIRHGGRPLIRGRSIRQLYVDLTSLLIAEQLGLLDVIEESYAPLYLAPGVIPALYQQITEAQPHQPSKVENARVITSLIASKKLQVATVNIEEAAKEGGRGLLAARLKAAADRNAYLVDFLPVTIRMPPVAVSLTSEEEARIADCAAVLVALYRAGRLTEEEHERARRQLASLAEPSSSVDIPIGSNVLLHGNIVDVLAGAGVLQSACEAFTVYAESSEVEGLEGLLDYESRCAQLRGRLRAILDRIQLGISNIWRQLPEEPSDEEEAEDHPSRGIRQLITAKRDADTFVWVDDRLLSSFDNMGNNPVLTTQEVLWNLQERGKVTPSFVFDRFHRMRKANLRHIALDSTEVLHLLRSAKVTDGELIESPELTVLRQYVAACSSQDSGLQIPPVPDVVPQKAGEIPFLVSILTVVREGMIALWSECGRVGVDDVSARADWLLRSLWCVPASTPVVARNSVEPDSLFDSVGEAFAQLFMIGLGFDPQPSSRRPDAETPRALYFRWLETRLSSDPQTTDLIAKHLGPKFCSDHQVRGRSGSERRTFHILFGQVFRDLPKNIRSELRVSKKNLARMGVEQYDAVGVDECSFDRLSFSRGFEKAMNNRTAEVRARKPAVDFSFRFAEEDSLPVLYVTELAPPSREFRLIDEVFWLFHKDKAFRRTLLRSHPEWFDCGEEEFHRQADRIAATGAGPERLRLTEEFRRGAATYLYAALKQMRAAGRPVKLAMCEPPSARSLLNHLRLAKPPDPSQLQALLETASVELLRQVGFTETFRRIAPFPMTIPTALSAAYELLSAEQKADLFSEATAGKFSPTARMHAICLHFGTDPQSSLQAAEAILGERSEAEFDAFRSILYWSLRRVSSRRDFEGWPPSALLMAAWLHAGRIYEIFAGAPAGERVTEFFSAGRRPSEKQLFRIQSELLMDISHPEHVEWRSLVVHGLGPLFPGAIEHAAEYSRLQQRMRELCLINADGDVRPHSQLLCPADWHLNSLDSYVRGDRKTILGAILQEEADVFSTDRLASVISCGISAVRTGSLDAASQWKLLNATLNRVSPPPLVREQIAELIREIDMRVLTSVDAESRRSALFFLMHQMVHSPGLRPELRVKLLNVAEQLEEKALNQRPSQQDPTVLLECAHLLSCPMETVQLAAREFSAIILEMIGAWPRLSEEFWRIVRVLIVKLPAQVGAELWPLVFRLRELSGS